MGFSDRLMSAADDGASADLLRQIEEVDVFDLPQPNGDDIEEWLANEAYHLRMRIVGLSGPGREADVHLRMARLNLRRCERLLMFWRGIQGEKQSFAKWWKFNCVVETRTESESRRKAKQKEDSR